MTKVVQCVAIFFILTLPMLCLSEDFSFPSGWRLPNRSEITQEWRKRDPNRYLIVKADFNGDGIMDEARLLISNNNSELGLFTFISQKDETFKTFKLDEKKDINYIKVLGIVTVPPGRYETFCGFVGHCDEGELREIFIRYSAINYFKEGSANSFFYWDEQAMSFKQVWMND